MTAPADRVLRLPDDLDPAVLTDLLRASGTIPADAAVVAVEATPVGTGQMADTFRLALTHEPAGTGPSSIVAKLASANDTSRATGLALRSYEIEVRFYREIAPRVGMRVPASPHAAIEADTGWFTLLLEDAAPAVQGDDLAGCTPDVAAAALRELALLHGPCWEQPDLAGLEWLNRSSGEATDGTAMLVGMLWTGFVDRYRDRVAPADMALGERLMAGLPGLLRRPGPRTAAHGDYRLDNMLFRGDDPRPYVVDWQTLTWGAPAGDVSYFLGFALVPEVRRVHEDALVAGYHEALLATGVTGYDLDALRQDVRAASFGGMIMAIAASMLVEQTSRGDDMFMAMYGRSADHAVALDAADLLSTGAAGDHA